MCALDMNCNCFCAACNSPSSSLHCSKVLVITSWIFLRSALGINIVAVFAARRKGRCWKVQFSVGRRSQSVINSFVGENEGRSEGWVLPELLVVARDEVREHFVAGAVAVPKVHFSFGDLPGPRRMCMTTKQNRQRRIFATGFPRPHSSISRLVSIDSIGLISCLHEI